MAKRIVWLHGVFLFCLTVLMVRLSVLGQGESLAQAAARQSTSLLELGTSRGTIYDRYGKPLVNRSYVTALAVSPTPEGMELLRENLPQEELPEALEVLRQGRPMVVRSSRYPWLPDTQPQGAAVFRLPVRYSGEQLAVHLLGYVDESGHGVAGIEKGYDDLLREMGGSVYARYFVDANRSAVEDRAAEVVDQRTAPQGGVVLTLDRGIQEAAEAAMADIRKGAAVVMEVETGEVLAMVSRPAYDLTRLEEALSAPDSPFFNRALGAYNVGSTFKLCVAAAALEQGFSPYYSHQCQGYYQLGEQKYHCHYRYGHGELTMAEALEKSCNPYFINLGMQVGGEALCDMAYRMGFGSSAKLGEGVTAAAGVLPKGRDLWGGDLANFSFGQGEFTATPVQIAQMISAIANGGRFVSPTVYRGTTLNGGDLELREEPAPGAQIIKPSTAAALQTMLIGVVERGSGTRARPDRGGAGGKTATAQTGIFQGEEEVLHGWFAGFYPAREPRYAVVIFAEGGGEGSEVPAQAFAALCDGIADCTKS
ncbi:MAG: hypothetical protein HFF10_04085 [Angelakisella sp.]|nr:hypothetical protein [Angelakisella sp.]